MTAGAAQPTSPPLGLTAAEAKRRALAGLANRTSASPSRTVAEILRSNLLTRFNALLGSLLVVILVVGPLQDALFGLILACNSAIGILQELRAKLVLDRLALVRAPAAEILRDGRWITVPAAEVVQGDVLMAREGEETAADLRVLETRGLEVNEALLTGESRPVAKPAGEVVLAGSFVVAGSAVCAVERVGDASYAGRVSAEARRFHLVRSELMNGINRILRGVTWLIPPMAVILVATQLRANPSLADALRGSVAGLVTLVPEGLVLLTSLTLAVAVVRLGRRRVLVQQLAAVEMLARADVVCFDKTGTLTDGRVRLERLEPVAEGARGSDGSEALAAMIATDPRGELADLLTHLPPAPGWQVKGRVPFSSERRWTAVDFGQAGTWVLGAPEALLRSDAAALHRSEALAASGRRVLLLGRLRERGLEISDGVLPFALVVLSEGLRAEAGAVLAKLVEQGVGIQVLSGDHPSTVKAVVAALGLASGAAVEVRGRVTPDEKARTVQELRAAGHTVAMVGDGVNDVLALKAADLAMAIGTGSTAARAVSAIVLLDPDFAAVPHVIGEGRRVIANVERLASLFVTKTAYAALLGLGSAAFLLPFPFLPRHMTLVAAFTVGIPAFFLALAPSTRPVRPGFLGRVLRFALPAGLVAAVMTFAGYYLALQEAGVTLAEARTAATVVLAGLGVWILSILARPLTPARRWLVAAMAAGLAVSALVTPIGSLFGLDMPDPLIWLGALGLIFIGGVVLEAGLKASGWVWRAIGLSPDRRVHASNRTGRGA